MPIDDHRDRLPGTLALILGNLPYLVQRQIVSEGEELFLARATKENPLGLSKAELRKAFRRLARNLARAQHQT